MPAPGFPTECFKSSRPFDDAWFARLRDVTSLAETRALAASMRRVNEEELKSTRCEARDLRAALDLSEWARAGIGLSYTPHERAPHKERNELADLRRYVSQRLLRDPDWTREQIQTIREFASSVPARDRDRLSKTLGQAEACLALAARERESEEQARAQLKARAINEGLNRLDERYVVEACATLDLERDVGHERIKLMERELIGRYAESLKGYGPESAQCAPANEALRSRAIETVASVIDLAERMRDTLHVALLDDPPPRLLAERLEHIGMTLRYRQSESRQVTGADLTYGGVSVDTRSLGERLDGRALDERSSRAGPPRHSREAEQTIRACMKACPHPSNRPGIWIHRMLLVAADSICSPTKLHPFY